MKLSELLRGIKFLSNVNGDIEIKDMTNNSRVVEKGFVYVAIKGSAVDGHKFVDSAINQGAVAVVVEKDMGIQNQVIVEDTRKAYAVMASNYFKNPCEKLKLIGVTGTNGKTSVTTIVKHILEYVGLKTGLIGTIQIEYGDVVLENKNTTPDAYVFHKTLSQMEKAGCEYVVSEVSSHALDQDRLYGCKFEIGAFTNLTQDHLDYHKDMEDYFNAKKKLFSMCEKSVININDDYGYKLAKEIGKNVDTVSFKYQDSTFYADNIECKVNGVNFEIKYNDVISKVSFAIPGLYSVENALVAIGIVTNLGVSLNKAITALSLLNGIKGRCEIVYSDDKMSVICDYAHTPDGIENILSSLKESVNGRLVALFGCGGDRDKTKRPLMAKATEKYADFIIVTSDNPRSEDPQMIIEDVIVGLSDKANFVKIVDRRKAIEYAMKNALDGDTIVLLGKGHEDYQVLKDETIHFDEREVVAEIAETL